MELIIIHTTTTTTITYMFGTKSSSVPVVLALGENTPLDLEPLRVILENICVVMFDV
jgi:hypothetical protein